MFRLELDSQPHLKSDEDFFLSTVSRKTCTLLNYDIQDLKYAGKKEGPVMWVGEPQLCAACSEVLGLFADLCPGAYALLTS